MPRNVLSALLLVLFTVTLASAQDDLRIKKSLKIKVPGLEASLAGLPQKTQASMNESLNRSQNVFIKGPRVRTDTSYKKQTATGLKNRNMTTITQCDRGRTISFSDDKKKYFAEDATAATAAAKRGGFVTISVVVTDTGERMKLFGFDSKHIKQQITITPNRAACMKEKVTMEIDGWYADIPSYSCPIRPDVNQLQESKNCYDEIVFDIRGKAVTGFPVKEIKTFMVEGQKMAIEEEVTALERTSLSASLFEPPAGYVAGNSKAEVYTPSEAASTNGPSAPTAPGVADMPNSSPPMAATLPPPGAGVATPAASVYGPKQPGSIRVGIVKPKVTTPETKKDANAGWELAQAVTKSVVENLKAANIDAVELTTENPAAEASEKQCDFVLTTSVTQKRGGGGMGFGKMLAMSGMMMAGAMIPGVGSMIATTVASQVMNQTMNKSAKAKDEFTFDHKLTNSQGAAVDQGTTKKKTEKDGEDVLSPQIKAATDSIVGKIRT